MNKYEKFVLNHYLTEWDESLSTFDQVIKELISCNDHFLITETYQAFWPEVLASMITDMKINLEIAMR